MMLGSGCADLAGPEPGPLVHGSWRYASSISSGATVCTIEGSTLQLQQTGRTFERSLEGGIIRCSTSGLWNSMEIGRDLVLNGLIGPGEISFDIGSPDFHHRGSTTGDEISSSTTMRVEAGGPILLMVGSFQAERM